MSNNQQKKDLYEYIIEHDVFNTHTHHLQDTFFRDLSLKKIFEQSYVHWQKYPLTNDYNSRYNYLSKIRYKSYFVWLEKALQNIYNFSDSITPNNWDMIDKMIISTYQKDNNYNLDILKNKCNYTEIILDAYWKPGSDNYHPEVFKSTFRIDPLLQGYSIKPVDHDGNSPFKLYNRVFSNLDEYVDWIKILIKQQKTDGCIALKSAVAYDRGLDFHNTSRNRAKKIFEIKDKDFTPDIIKDFQDYVFQIICELAADNDLPLQCHTGMGILDETRAMAMHEIIARNPNTKFVLFHCSFPWTDDICALLHNYPNVYPDLCWLPILSYTASKKMLHQLIEIGTIDKISWGCDTRTAEESHGALLAFKSVLYDVLCEKIDSGYLTYSNSIDIVNSIMINNARNIYIK